LVPQVPLPAIPDVLNRWFRKRNSSQFYFSLSGVVMVVAVTFGPEIIMDNDFLKDEYETLFDLKNNLWSISNNVDIDDVSSSGLPALVSDENIEADLVDDDSKPVDLGDPFFSEENTTNLTVDEHKPVTVVPTEKVVPEVFVDDTFDILSSHPNDFLGHPVLFSGQAYDIEVTSSARTPGFKIHSPFSIDLNRLIIHAEGNTIRGARLVEQDCVRVHGTVVGSTEEKSSIGVPMTVPVISAERVEKIDCIESVFPSTDTLLIGKSQTNKEITVVLETIQFAEKHVRAKITVTNTGVNQKVFLRESESTIIQNETILKNINYRSELSQYAIDSRLLPEFTVTGYLFFERIGDLENPFSLKIIIEEATIVEDFRSEFDFKVL
jgi:hypothetical protein